MWSFPVTALDDPGIPPWSVTLIPGPASVGHGYGWTELKAKVSALGELHGRLQSLLNVPKLPLEWASYTGLCGLYGAAHVVDPLTLCLPAGSAYTPAQTLAWTTMRRFRGGATRCWSRCRRLEPRRTARRLSAALPARLQRPRGGLSREAALTHALLELLQLDGNSVSYRALDQGCVLDLAGVANLASGALLARLRALGLELRVKLAATDFGLSTSTCWGAA